MTARLAGDDEVAAWHRDGWVLLDGLIGTAEVDRAAEALSGLFPSPEEYHADPAGTRRRWLGEPPEPRHGFRWPDEGPGFRPEQHRWSSSIPLPPDLQRLGIHPSITDFAARALGTADLRLYQAGLSAKYTGDTNYEQPMHTDRNHSWLPPRPEGPWWHLETFLYLSDVEAGNAPTHLVPVGESAGRSPTVPLIMPARDPDLYAAERPAPGVRGSLLAYRPDVFHRAVNLTAPGGHRYLLNVSYKPAGLEWVAFHNGQSSATSPDWVRFVETCTPADLALFGWPGPGHPIWTAEFLDTTAELYPALDLGPWRSALT